MYAKSNMETYITMYKIANGNLLYGSGNSTGALYQPRGMGWGRRWEGGSKGGDICIPMADYIKAVYCHPAYLTYMQSTS